MIFPVIPFKFPWDNVPASPAKERACQTSPVKKIRNVLLVSARTVRGEGVVFRLLTFSVNRVEAFMVLELSKLDSIEECP